MARPSPAPPSRPRRGSWRPKRSKIRRRASVRHPRPAVGNGEAGLGCVVPDGDQDPTAPGREADGVVEEVADDLVEAIAIAVDEHGIALHDHVDVAGRGRRVVCANGSFGELVQVLGLAQQRQMSFVDVGEGEEVVDDSAHAHDLLARAGEHRSCVVLERVVAQADLQLHAHRRKGSAELVGGVGDQSLAGVDALLEAVQHRVEGAREVAELVVDARDGDPLGEVVETDLVRAPGHPLDGSERLSSDPPAAEARSARGRRRFRPARAPGRARWRRRPRGGTRRPRPPGPGHGAAR